MDKIEQIKHDVRNFWNGKEVSAIVEKCLEQNAENINIKFTVKRLLVLFRKFMREQNLWVFNEFMLYELGNMAQMLIYFGEIFRDWLVLERHVYNENIAIFFTKKKFNPKEVYQYLIEWGLESWYKDATYIYTHQDSVADTLLYIYDDIKMNHKQFRNTKGGSTEAFRLQAKNLFLEKMRNEILPFIEQDKKRRKNFSLIEKKKDKGLINESPQEEFMWTFDNIFQEKTYQTLLMKAFYEVGLVDSDWICVPQASIAALGSAIAGAIEYKPSIFKLSKISIISKIITLKIVAPQKTKNGEPVRYRNKNHSSYIDVQKYFDENKDKN